MPPCSLKLSILSVICTGTIVLSGGSLHAQDTPLFHAIFGQQNSSSNKKKTTSSSTKRKSSSSSQKSSSQPTDLLTALTGKTAKERAREEYLRKKAAEKKAQEEAQKKAQAAAARKKAAEKRAYEAALRKKEEDKKKALAAAAKKKAAEQKARETEARKKALAEAKAKEERARQLAAAARERENQRRQVELDRLREQQRVDSELVALARGNYRRGLFGNWSRSSSSSSRSSSRQRVTQPTRYLYINEREINNLNASNSRVEIDLGDQRARVYRGSILVIETQISSGKPGFTTPTGRYSVKEKLVDKQSGRYGTWYNAQGVKLNGDDHFDPPPGGVKFVGADMPYWLRITGGIGMHVGYVPNGPASHGCIRVPSTVQPLIFSKVKVGTSVTIKS